MSKKKTKARTTQWMPVADMNFSVVQRIEMPRPLPLEFTPREMSYLLISTRSNLHSSVEDQIGRDMLTKLYGKLFVVWRAYLQDIEALEIQQRAAQVPMTITTVSPDTKKGDEK